MTTYQAPSGETVLRIVAEQDREAAEALAGCDHGAPVNPILVVELGPDYICTAMDGAVLAWGAYRADGARELIVV